MAEQKYANTDKNNYIATGSVRVTVMGRLYDFCVTNVIDYPRWERVFWKEGKTARTDTVYFSGTNDLNGIRQRSRTACIWCRLSRAVILMIAAFTHRVWDIAWSFP